MTLGSSQVESELQVILRNKKRAHSGQSCWVTNECFLLYGHWTISNTSHLYQMLAWLKSTSHRTWFPLVSIPVWPSVWVSRCLCRWHHSLRSLLRPSYLSLSQSYISIFHRPRDEERACSNFLSHPTFQTSLAVVCLFEYQRMTS